MIKHLPEYLIKAIYKHDYATLKKRLSKENVNLLCAETRYSLLHLAVSEEAEKKIIDLLIKKGADVNLRAGTHLRAPLHSAVASLNIAIINQLLEAGADPNLQDVSGWTPLLVLATIADPRYVPILLLIKAGADPFFNNPPHETPFKMAESRGFSNVFAQAIKEAKTKKKKKS